MEPLIFSTFRAVRSLFTPGMLGVFLLSIVVTIASLFGFIAVAGIFFSWAGTQMHDHVLGHIIPWLGSIGASMLAWFLFPGIMPLIISFFDDRIAGVIERYDYPAATGGYKPNFWTELWHDMRFALIIIALNILMLPLYLIMHIFSPVPFYLLNGYLLGREFFGMVARRHMPAHEAEHLRKRYSRSIWVAGIMLAVMATVPLVNFFAPFWGIAVMVHLYHKLGALPPSQILLTPR